MGLVSGYVSIAQNCDSVGIRYELLAMWALTWNESAAHTLDLGENNCHGVMGNAAQQSGYGCEVRKVARDIAASESSP